MTEAATAAPAGVTTTDLLSSSAAAATLPAPSFMPAGFPVTPPAFNAPEAVAARAEIDTLKSDKEFYAAMKAERERGLTGPASQRWSDLHRKGWPSPAAITSQADVESQATARNSEEWNKYFGWLRQQFRLTPENEAELRAGVIRADLHQWAKEEKDRLVRDQAWRRRMFDGGRKEVEEWSRITLMLSLRPVKQQ